VCVCVCVCVWLKQLLEKPNAPHVFDSPSCDRLVVSHSMVSWFTVTPPNSTAQASPVTFTSLMRRKHEVLTYQTFIWLSSYPEHS